MKNFDKAMGKVNSEWFQYLSKKFVKVSAAKLKEGIFVWPQIRVVLMDMEFQKALSPLELKAFFFQRRMRTSTRSPWVGQPDWYFSQ